jgi:small subunit ribosomal protein S20
VAKRTESAKKQARSGARRAVRNRATRSAVKTLVVKARRAIGEAPAADTDRSAVTLEAIRALDRAAAKGVLHPNNAARRKARLARSLAKVAVAPTAPAPPAAKGKSKGAAAPAPPAAKKAK